MDADKLVETYKSLSQVERAFRAMKTTVLNLRPVFHREEDLATLCRITIRPAVSGTGSFHKLTEPPAVQATALSLLDVTLKEIPVTPMISGKTSACNFRLNQRTVTHVLTAPHFPLPTSLPTLDATPYTRYLDFSALTS